MRRQTRGGAALSVALTLAVLFTMGSAGAQEFRAVGQLRPAGPATSPAAAKIVSSLRALIQEFRAEGITRETAPGLGVARRYSSPLLKVDDGGRVQVYVSVADTSPATLAALRRHDLDVEIVNDQFGLVQGWISVEQLETLAAEPAVRKIEPPSYGTTRAGAVTSQGDAIHRCDAARAGGPITGAGVKVGVISDGVSGLAQSQFSGDVSPFVQVLSPGTGDEGTAMLEIVHDCAPGATLLFSSGLPTSLAFINSVNSLRNAGAKVIVDDVGFFSEPFFEDGPVALNDRTAGAVVLRVSAAGNDRRTHYAGTFTAGPLDSEVGGRRHIFSGGALGDTLLRFRVAGGGTAAIVLQWANRFGFAGDDYDLCVRQTSGVLLDCSAGVQDGNDDPVEAVMVSCPAGPACLGDIQITLFQGVARLLKFFCVGDCVLDEFAVADGSIFGQPGVPEVLAVAAAPAINPAAIEPYSSEGPVKILFPATQTRAKPDVTGIDCVSTTRPGFTTFCGTSAAAPHVAGIAALVLQAKPLVGVAELRKILQLAAIDLGVTGFDSSFGFGRADALNGTLLFVDVRTDNIFRAWIEALFNAGVTGGCATTPLRYCPALLVTRGEMAAFLLKAKESAAYTPPACVVQLFLDVPCSHPLAAWINELSNRGVTAGCGGGNYCPEASVTREQMAPFLLRTKESSGYVPPTCGSPPFLDVPCASPFAIWIQELVVRGIVAGCGGGNYCPASSVTREQMAVFLVKTFGLPFP